MQPNPSRPHNAILCHCVEFSYQMCSEKRDEIICFLGFAQRILLVYADVSRQRISPVFKGGTYRMSCNIGKHLLTYAA
jgi:hypothetical protein